MLGTSRIRTGGAECCGGEGGLPTYVATQFFGYEATQLLSYSVTKLLSYSVTKPRSHEATQLRSHEATKPRSHEATKPRSHEAFQIPRADFLFPYLSFILKPTPSKIF